MDNVAIKNILEKHANWLSGAADGKKANLSGADLSGANLYKADLYGADLSGANLYKANLHGANLYKANLSGADLSGANLYKANLHGAYLSGADLYGADLSGANLYKANLSGADLSGADMREADLRGANLNGANLNGAKIEEHIKNKFFPLVCPDSGSFTAWKSVRGGIAKLLIPEDAKRSSAYGRKCRASKAVVVAIYDKNGTPINEARSHYDHDFIYKPGDTVEVVNFNEDRWNECSTGIHFFITRQEAEGYDG